MIHERYSKETGNHLPCRQINLTESCRGCSLGEEEWRIKTKIDW
jgi:hypothetical protein